MKTILKTVAIYAAIMLNSCNVGVRNEVSKKYTVLEKIPIDDGECVIYWIDHYRLRSNKIKCDSCFIGQKIGEGGLKI
jgi:hypothetical protein